MNVQEFQRSLGESGLDAVVAVSQPNVFYTSGAYILTQVSIPDRLAMTVLPASGDDALLVCNIEESLARQESWIDDVRSYVEFAEAPFGIIGLETSLALSLRGLGAAGLDLPAILGRMTSAPAGILGLDAGTLRPGAGAILR